MRVAAMVLACTVVFASSRADACQCSREPEDLGVALSRRRERAGAIFHGRVVSVKGPSRLLRMLGLDAKGEVTIEVREVLKGRVGATAKLETESVQTTCDVTFVTGQDYLVYAQPRGAHFVVGSFCAGTRTAGVEDEELRWLRTGELPRTPESAGP